MRRPAHLAARLGALALLLSAALAWPLSAAAPSAKPEEVGLSSDRLNRIDELIQRLIDAGTFSGAGNGIPAGTN